MPAFITQRNWRRLILLLLCTAMISLQGCLVRRERYSLASMWADYNTLRAPAIFLQKQEHMPYKARQVSYFHWQYGVTPGRDVKYSRPDLVGGLQGAGAAPYEAVVNVGATENEHTPPNEPTPSVIPNGAMTIPYHGKVSPPVTPKKPYPQSIPPSPEPPPAAGTTAPPPVPPAP
ncbi:hypothetical protein [Gimesia aquarii]|uniref:Uncharacterized protein n=1 Tax=Gimesia aquarii TaxID=2527964 RepID=A0A517WQL6_9PLAN|nr:hypothetical protein [Gimesia aquarii]QDU07545.1 hypothetical protein V202x_09030 [Gimesia aquarii]